ncbi:MAG: hypothetical protein LBI10_08645, partial [Deltaproteobacteria bacterium]|nr:hypothetical protein [Deltaproteobacteria bacterium]
LKVKEKGLFYQRAFIIIARFGFVLNCYLRTRKRESHGGLAGFWGTVWRGRMEKLNPKWNGVKRANG